VGLRRRRADDPQFVDARSDTEYEPLSFPDRELIRDVDGTPIRMAFGSNGIIPCTAAKLKEAGLTGDDCQDAALDQFSKFGFFRTALPTYDRQVGSTQEGRQYYANRWNIWKETIQKDNGKPLIDPQTGRASPFSCRSARRGRSPTT
jgi:hypothetical protein